MSGTILALHYFREILPIKKDLYPELVIKAAKHGYRIDTKEVLPVMKITDTVTGLKKVVSVYSILDEEI